MIGNLIRLVPAEHRGALTGYAGGLDRKRALLALEQNPARFTLAA